MNPVDAHLDDVATAQLMWKPSATRDFAAQIVTKALKVVGTFWPDELTLRGVKPADKNCVGTAYRLLAKYGVIAWTVRHRRSKREDSAGRQVFEYRLASEALARRWLKENGYDKAPPRREEQLVML